MLLASAIAGPTTVPLPSSPADPEYAADLRRLAIVVAVSGVASGRCAEIEINGALLKALQQHIGYDEVHDSAELGAAVRDFSAAIGQEIAHAPNVVSWCDGIYGMYGPSGTMVPGLMLM